MFFLISQEIEEYCEKYSSVEDPVLYELYRETNLKTVRPRMVCGHTQGLFLQFISKMLRPKRILELGTFTAYATICLSKGLDPEGLIYTIDENIELESIIRKYLKKASVESKTKLYFGKALDIIPILHETWDLIYIDADKINYLNYYKLLLPSLSNNGIILADNVLWSGKIAHDVNKKDKDTHALNEFNRYVQQDLSVTNILLPLRDGIMMIRKN